MRAKRKVEEDGDKDLKREVPDERTSMVAGRLREPPYMLHS